MSSLYYAIVDKVYSLSYLNLGTPSQFRLPDYYIIRQGFKSQVILYTKKETKILKELHPDVLIIPESDIDAHFYRHSAFFRMQHLEYKKEQLAKQQLKHLNLN